MSALHAQFDGIHDKRLSFLTCLSAGDSCMGIKLRCDYIVLYARSFRDKVLKGKFQFKIFVKFHTGQTLFSRITKPSGWGKCTQIVFQAMHLVAQQEPFSPLASGFLLSSIHRRCEIDKFEIIRKV